MKPHWNRKLSRVLRTTEEMELRTLAEAATYATNPDTLPLYYPTRNEWQHAARLMMEAANGGDVEAATQAIENALFLTARLYFNQCRRESGRNRSDEAVKTILTRSGLPPNISRTYRQHWCGSG
jgi:hypothetical protein